jgi:hypothetical protein
VVNKHFQPIAELKSIMYVGGRTPNAFPNRTRGRARRHQHLPEALVRLLGGLPRQPESAGRDVHGHLRRPELPGRLHSTSDDPHGFIFQFFIGHRNERLPTIFPNQPPTVSLSASSSRVVLPAECTGTDSPDPNCTPTAGTVQLSANATDPDGDTLLYTYSTTGGRVTGDGPNATLDLTGVAPGTYTVTVEVDDGCGCIAFTSTTVTVERCNCIPHPPPPCPTVTVSCPSDTGDARHAVTFTANVSAATRTSRRPSTGRSRPAPSAAARAPAPSPLTRPASGGNSTVTATVDVGGYDRLLDLGKLHDEHSRTRRARKIDEYGNIRFNDEKARLDNYAIELQNDPTAQGYLICYGGRRAGRARPSAVATARRTTWSTRAASAATAS